MISGSSNPPRARESKDPYVKAGGVEPIRGAAAEAADAAAADAADALWACAAAAAGDIGLTGGVP
jgi:hypothetical protein